MLPVRKRDYEPGEVITQWQIPLSWWENHTSSNLRYYVRLRVNDSVVLNAAWRELSQRYATHDGDIWIGGAYLRRVDPETVDAVSGGEDALDSLEWAVNDDLIKALHKVNKATATRITVVHHLRIEL